MTATIALPRQQPHSEYLARLRTVGLGLGGRGVMGMGLGRSAVSAAEVPWWLAGGAPTPVAVYQPKGAASLAASYVNLANPGTYDAAPGVAPTFDAATGWTFNGSTQYLTTGIVPSATWSLVIRVSGLSSVSGIVCGSRNGIGIKEFGLWPNTGTNRIYSNGSRITLAGGNAACVMAVADRSTYLDGSADSASVPGGSYTGDYAILIGKFNNAGTAALGCNGRILALALWNTSTNHATWMPAVSAAVALI